MVVGGEEEVDVSDHLVALVIGFRVDACYWCLLYGVKVWYWMTDYKSQFVSVFAPGFLHGVFLGEGERFRGRGILDDLNYFVLGLRRVIDEGVRNISMSLLGLASIHGIVGHGACCMVQGGALE